MASYLVTGGGGFIGSHIVERLAGEGNSVVIVDNLSTGKRENIEFSDPIKRKITLIEIDLVDLAEVRKAVSGVDAIFHQGALGSVPKSVKDPIRSHEANVTGTLNLLVAAKDAGITRVVNAASSSAYGDTPTLPKVETMPPNPFSPYAATKLAQENYCRSFAVSYGMETVSLRYFNVFGPRQDPSSQYAAVVPKFFDAYLRGEVPTIYGDGEQTRDFTYIGDVVEANILASKMKGASGDIFNIAGGKAVSVNELAQKIRELTGGKGEPKFEEARAGDVKHSLADISAARSRLGFAPKTSLDQGLKICLDWYRRQV